MAPKRKRIYYDARQWFTQKLPTKKEYFEWKKVAGFEKYYKDATSYKHSLLNIMAEELSLHSRAKRCFFCQKLPVLFELFEKLENWYVLVPSKDIICPECLSDMNLLSFEN
jgi:hypothetical protein